MTVLQMLKPHAGLRVLVTGGASGIGLVIARAFVDAGSRVHVCDASQQAIDALLEAESHDGVNAITATLADVSDRAAVDRVFADVDAQLGGLDVLINNAGIAGPTGGIDETGYERLGTDHRREPECSVLLRAPRGAALAPRERGRNDHRACRRWRGASATHTARLTAATKWAVVGLTKSLAIELGPSNIRVNAIQPGIVKGPRIERVIAARARATRPLLRADGERVSREDFAAPHDDARGSRGHRALSVFAGRQRHLGPGDLGLRQRRSALNARLNDSSRGSHGNETQSHHHLCADGRDPYAVDVAASAGDAAGDRRRGARGRAKAGAAILHLHARDPERRPARRRTPPCSSNSCRASRRKPMR